MARTYYIWDEVNDTLLMEKDEIGNTTAAYTYEPGQNGPLISQRRGGQTSYYHFDGQGSTRQLTDANQNVTDSYTFTAFGEPVAQSGTTTNPFGYRGALGYYLNPESGGLYVRARTYQPMIARWASRRASGVKLGHMRRPSYAESNPMTVVSPARTSPILTFEGVGRAILAMLAPVSPFACGSVCGGQFYGKNLPGGDPLVEGAGFREGMFFGVLWVDNGTCPGAKVHVKLLYTTLTIVVEEHRIECNRVAEEELLGGTVIPKAKFVPEENGCNFLVNGTITPRSGTPPDCSFVTFEWECPINCRVLFEVPPWFEVPGLKSAKLCAAGVKETQIISVPPESYWIAHDVEFSDLCCKTWPCNARLLFKDQIGAKETHYDCWDFRRPPYFEVA